MPLCVVVFMLFVMDIEKTELKDRYAQIVANLLWRIIE